MSDWFTPPPDDDRDLFLAGFIIFAVCVFALAAALAFSGCGGTPAAEVKYVEKVVAVPTTVRCAKVAPPKLSPIGAPVVCLTGMVCLTTLDAATLVDNVERLKSWVVETWTLCAPEVK